MATLRATGVKERTDGPSAVVLSPDGNTVATIGWSRYVDHSTLVRWDVRDPRKPRQLPVVEDTSVMQDLLQGDRAAFSPDGRLLATADTHGELRLWDVSDPREPRPRGMVEDSRRGPGVQPGRRSAGGEQRSRGQTDRHPLARQADSPRRTDSPHRQGQLPRLLPDGRRLASAGWDKTVAVWDVGDPRDMTMEARLYGHSSFVNATRFGADGHSLVSVSFSEVIHWDLADVHRPRVLDVLPDADELALAPDGTTLAVARGARIGLWDLADPAEPRRLAKLSNPVKERYDLVGGGTSIGTGDVLADIDFSPDGTLLATMNHDRRVTLWDLSDPARPRIAGSLRGNNEGALGPSLAFAPDRRLLAVSDRKHVQVWDVSNPARPALTASRADPRLEDVAFSPDGHRLLLAGTSLRLWDLRTGKTALLSGDHFYQGGSTAAFSPRGNVVAAVAAVPPISEPDTGVHLWDTERAGSARPLGETEPTESIREKFARLAFHPDGDLLAGAGEDGAVRVWSVADPERPHLAFTFSRHLKGVDEVVLGGPHGRTMITSSAGYANVVDIGDYPEIAADTIGMACRAAGNGFTREEWEERVPEAEYRESCPDSSADENGG